MKKNLYWEVKEKVIEEAFNGYRMDKVKRKVKVYGTNSDKKVRARLIEILMERVKYHKDKFICPLLWDEMRAMEVKKSGKIEHSSHTHDDTVFGYLMALYVWYDGKNLIENFGIQKMTLKTDQDEELFEDTFEDAIEKREKITIDNSLTEDRNDIQETLEWVEKSVGIKTGSQLMGEQFVQRLNMRDSFIIQYPELNDRLIEKTGVNVTPNQQHMTTGQITLPDELFNPEIDLDLDDEIDFGNQGSFSTNKSPLVGNLSQFYDML